MTVLIAVNTADAIILAADSQGTTTRSVIDPDDLAEFFDAGDHRLKLDEQGRPLLSDWAKISARVRRVPHKVYSNVEKIYPLEPLNMAVMASGISAMGDRTVKSLVGEFKTTKSFASLALGDYTMAEVGAELQAFFSDRYEDKYGGAEARPGLELMLCGYDRARYTPGVLRVYVDQASYTDPDYDFCVFFGGTTRETERLLFGIDAEGKRRISERNEQLFEDYHRLLTRYLEENGVSIELPKPSDFGRQFDLFHGWKLDTVSLNCVNYSERTAIECAEFFVNVVTKTQRFSTQVPIAGGDPVVAIIRKDTGFRFLKPQEPPAID